MAGRARRKATSHTRQVTAHRWSLNLRRVTKGMVGKNRRSARAKLTMYTYVEPVHPVETTSASMFPTTPTMHVVAGMQPRKEVTKRSLVLLEEAVGWVVAFLGWQGTKTHVLTSILPRREPPRGALPEEIGSCRSGSCQLSRPGGVPASGWGGSSSLLRREPLSQALPGKAICLPRAQRGGETSLSGGGICPSALVAGMPGCPSRPPALPCCRRIIFYEICFQLLFFFIFLHLPGLSRSALLV